ncbi:transporter substrate-binding domain-containing protein [Chitinibacter sp. GC72]|uniref:transporter substrate-binding domain-containing protein n=1 Tax=Chitinibacter sp. GC72 TaxID=1526917 RepID=UPI0012FCE9E6|nr:transporter substrate-binding domain-containing protein [Chitinibacter sp. GC72]
MPVPFLQFWQWLAYGAISCLFCLSQAAAAQDTLLRLRFAPEKDYGPFIFQNERGQLQGLSYDILQALLPLANLELINLPPRPLAEILAQAKSGEVDLVSSLRATPERAQYLGFTRPYVAVPAVLIRRQDRPSKTLAQLTGVRIAVGRGYAVESFVREQHPRINWLTVSDDSTAMQMLAHGQIDGLVADIASVIFIAKQHQQRDWRVEQHIGFDYQLSFAFPLSQPEIGLRLNQALQQLPLVKREEILQRWLSSAEIEQASPIYRQVQWFALIFLGASVLLALRYYFRSRHARR